MEQRLGLAQEQRRIMTVTFLNPALSLAEFSGPCFHIDGGSIFIDCPYHTRYATCHGEAVKVQFSLEHQNVTTYFQFTSKIRGYKPGNGIVLDTPTELHSNQRREFLRISPPIDTLLHMNVWPIDIEGLSPRESFAAAYEGFLKKNAGVVLVNISAGGLRLQTSNHPDDPVAASGLSARLLCFLRLRNMNTRRVLPKSNIRQGKTEALDIWLTALVKYRMEHAEFSNVSLGLNFIAWAMPEAQNKLPSWCKAGKGGHIPLLGDWVWQQHLKTIAQYRYGNERR